MTRLVANRPPSAWWVAALTLVEKAAIRVQKGPIKNIFVTPFIPAKSPSDAFGTWRAYYEK
jgi:hypothetical protein